MIKNQLEKNSLKSFNTYILIGYRLYAINYKRKSCKTVLSNKPYTKLYYDKRIEVFLFI